MLIVLYIIIWYIIIIILYLSNGLKWQRCSRAHKLYFLAAVGWRWGCSGPSYRKLTAQDSKVPNDKATNKRYLEVKGLGKQVKSYPQ